VGDSEDYERITAVKQFLMSYLSAFYYGSVQRFGINDICYYGFIMLFILNWLITVMKCSWSCARSEFLPAAPHTIKTVNKQLGKACAFWFTEEF